MAEMTVILESMSGPTAGTKFRLAGDAVVIGRSPDVDIPLTEASSISRKHAKLEKRDDGAYLVDLDSQNGSFVNGERVGEVRLADGMTFKLGQEEFRVSIEGEQAVAPASTGADVPAAPNAPGNALETSPVGDDAPPAGGVADELALDPRAGASEEEIAAAEAAESGRSFLWQAMLLATIIMALLYFLSMTSGGDSLKRVSPRIMEVHETLVVDTPEFDDVRVISPEGISVVQWARFQGMLGEKSAVVLRGARPGDARVEVLQGGRVVDSFEVIVRGVRERELIDQEANEYSPEKAAEIAPRLRTEAEELARTQPYAAMRRFEAAGEYFRRARDIQSARECQRKAEDIQITLRNRLLEHMTELEAAVKDRRFGTALNHVRKMKQLVPDEQNVDWQFINNMEHVVERYARRYRR